jgi:hypothetical protein
MYVIGQNAMNWAVMFGSHVKQHQRALVAMLHPKIPFQPRKKKKTHDNEDEEDALALDV